jgi:hypothetical protein
MNVNERICTFVKGLLFSLFGRTALTFTYELAFKEPHLPRRSQRDGTLFCKSGALVTEPSIGIGAECADRWLAKPDLDTRAGPSLRKRTSTAAEFWDLAGLLVHKSPNELVIGRCWALTGLDGAIRYPSIQQG